MTEEPRAEKDGSERESGDDAERNIIEFRERRQQGRPLELRLNEIVAGPGGLASDGHRLRLDLLSDSDRCWACRLTFRWSQRGWRRHLWRGISGDFGSNAICRKRLSPLTPVSIEPT